MKEKKFFLLYSFSCSFVSMCRCGTHLLRREQCSEARVWRITYMTRGKESVWCARAKKSKPRVAFSISLCSFPLASIHLATSHLSFVSRNYWLFSSVFSYPKNNFNSTVKSELFLLIADYCAHTLWNYSLKQP